MNLRIFLGIFGLVTFISQAHSQTNVEAIKIFGSDPVCVPLVQGPVKLTHYGTGVYWKMTFNGNLAAGLLKTQQNLVNGISLSFQSDFVSYQLTFRVREGKFDVFMGDSYGPFWRSVFHTLDSANSYRETVDMSCFDQPQSEGCIKKINAFKGAISRIKSQPVTQLRDFESNAIDCRTKMIDSVLAALK